MDGVNSGSNRRSAGRYTLEEAAQYVADNSTADAESMLSKLKGAAASLALTVYLTGSNERHTDMMRAASVRCGGEARGFRRVGGRIAQGDEEAYADDLNAWLAKNEPRLNWKFPTFHAPAATPAPVVAASDTKPWLLIDPKDPTPAQLWYTPARYFARQLAIQKPALLANRELLADKVSTALFNAGFKKRGDKLRFNSGTVLKAFANVILG